MHNLISIDDMGNHQLRSFIQTIPRVNVRVMFGDYALFVDELMFGTIHNNKLYLRIDPTSYDIEFSQLYQDGRRLPFFWSKHNLTKHIVDDAIRYSAFKKKSEMAQRSIKDMPNLNHRYERMLRKVGIDSVDHFEELGAIESFAALKRYYGQSVPIELALKFQGALERRHWSTISRQSRDSILTVLA